MTMSAERLYALLPAYDRVRDQESGRALEALIGVLSRTVAALDEDLDQLYDDQFIETCADWVVPYIGDLVGYRPLRPDAVTGGAARAEVADVIRLRRRKGTAAALEQSARDVTRHEACVIEWFRRLAVSQHLRHLRAEPRTTDLRAGAALADLGGPFDMLGHTADLRTGRHNIPNLSLLIWRLRDHPLTMIPATPDGASGRRFRFDPLGADAPLYNAAQADTDVTHLAEPVNVPGPIRRGDLSEHLTDYWDRAVAVRTADGPVAASRVRVCHLGGWMNEAAPGTVAIDPELGRIAFPEAVQDVRVTYQRVLAAPIGGGEYDRESTFDDVLRTAAAPVIAVPGPLAGTIEAALTWLGGADGVVEVTVPDPRPLPSLTLADGQRLELRAADGVRPLLTAAGDVTIDGGPHARLILDGLLIAGGGLRPGDGIDLLTVRHCTLVPGRVAVLAENAGDGFTLTVDRSIVGPVRLPVSGASVRVTGSIVDAGGDRRAWNSRLLLSGPLTPFPALSAATPALRVTIGVDGPYDVTLPSVPAGPAEAAPILQAAIRNAAPGPAFGKAIVTRVVGTRLAVLSGTGERVSIEAAGDDPTAAELKLDRTGSRRTTALFGVALLPAAPLRSAAPVLIVRMGLVEATVGGLSPGSSGLSTVRTQLQAALRSASADPAFSAAVVGLVGNRLLVVPGAEVESIAAAGTTDDPNTVDDLGLALRPAIGSGPSGASPGAAVSVERSTVIGPVFAREMPYVSESILLDAVRAERRQIGCIRFSYLPIESQTPRRHRCLPARAADADRIQPVFTTLHFGRPGYAQLAPVVPVELAAGAADGGEPGAHHDEQIFRRVADLRVRVAEQLRFGLDADVRFADQGGTA
jgi:hypothetical protein